MPKKRLLHTLGVRQTAVALAGLYGARMQAAGVAAMLHDIAKPLSLPEMQKKAQEYDLRLPERYICRREFAAWAAGCGHRGA